MKNITKLLLASLISTATGQSQEKQFVVQKNVVSTENIEKKLAREIYQAVTVKVPLAPISLKLPRETNLDYGYRIQAAFDKLMSKDYGLVTGYKMAYASLASQKKWGIPEPVSGTFMTKQQVLSGGKVLLDTFMGFHIETEIVFTLKKKVDKLIKTIDQLMPYIQSVHVGLDVPDLRYDTSKGKLTPVDVVAMSCGTHTYVIGKGVEPDGIDYNKIQLTLKRNNDLVYEGKATNVLGDPRESLRLLSNRLFSEGRPLKSCQFVFTGSVAGAYKGKDPSKNVGLYVGEASGLPPVTLYVE